MTAPVMPPATSAGRSTPSPKCAARARPLVTTEIASAGDSVPLGDLTLDRPSSVTPWRSSRNTVTTRLISSAPGGVSGSPIERPSWATRRVTISTSCSAESGTGSTTVLNRLRSALDSSLTPRSRSLAVRGFNVIATANDRDRGVNDLSSALRRRFNTVVLPVPASAEQEVDIVTRRVAQLGRSIGLPETTHGAEEIRRVVTVFRELRQGVTEDGQAKVKSPSGTLSTAEAISVVTSGLALAAHFGDGVLRPADVAGGITGAVVQDPVADRVVWQEYLETVIRDRDEWSDFYRACRDVAAPNG